MTLLVIYLAIRRSAESLGFWKAAPAYVVARRSPLPSCRRSPLR